MGSYNSTRGSAANSEDLTMVSSPTVAAAYVADFANSRMRCRRFSCSSDGRWLMLTYLTRWMRDFRVD
jgi:hypothetical protein